MTSETQRFFRPQSENSAREIPILTQEEVVCITSESEKPSLDLTVYAIRECLGQTIESISRAAECFESKQYVRGIHEAKKILQEVYSVVFDPKFDFTSRACVAKAVNKLFCNLVKFYESLGLLFMASKEHWEAEETKMGIVHNTLEGIVETIKLIQQSTCVPAKRDAGCPTNAVHCIKRAQNILLNACLFSQLPDNTEDGMKFVAALRMSMILSSVITDSAVFTKYNADVASCSTFYMKAALERLKRCRDFDGRCRIFDKFSDIVSLIAYFCNDAMKSCGNREIYTPGLRGRIDRKSSILMNVLEAIVLSGAFLSLDSGTTNPTQRNADTQTKMQEILHNIIYAYHTLVEQDCPNACRRTITKLLFNGAYIKLEKLHNDSSITSTNRKQLERIIVTVRRALDKINPDSPLYSKIWDSKISGLHQFPGEFPRDGRELISLPETPDFSAGQSRIKRIRNAVVSILNRLFSVVGKFWNRIKERCRTLWKSYDSISLIKHGSAIEEDQRSLMDSSKMLLVQMQERRKKERMNYITVEAEVHALPEGFHSSNDSLPNHTASSALLHSYHETAPPESCILAQVRTSPSSVGPDSTSTVTHGAQVFAQSSSVAESPTPTVTNITIDKIASRGQNAT